MRDPVTEFGEAIAAAGLTPPENILADGKLHRFAPNGKRGDDAGSYVLYVDGNPAGWFGDYRTGVNQKWRANRRRLPSTPEERSAYQAKWKALRALREAGDRARHLWL